MLTLWTPVHYYQAMPIGYESEMHKQAKRTLREFLESFGLEAHEEYRISWPKDEHSIHGARCRKHEWGYEFARFDVAVPALRVAFEVDVSACGNSPYEEYRARRLKKLGWSVIRLHLWKLKARMALAERQSA